MIKLEPSIMSNLKCDSCGEKSLRTFRFSFGTTTEFRNKTEYTTIHCPECLKEMVNVFREKLA